MTPMYIFDLDGTLALVEHRKHFIDQKPCPFCLGCCTVRREPVEIASRLPDGTVLPAMDPCQACNGTGKEPQDWKSFYAACAYDPPNWPVISTMNALLRSGADIQIWSGRSAEVMNETLAWLQRFFEIDAEEVQLVMRREGDFTPDDALKAQWLENLNEFDRRRLVAVFDDRDKVVAMWRRNGVACFQVAPGEF